jgi:hypothetical protein
MVRAVGRGVRDGGGEWREDRREPIENVGSGGRRKRAAAGRKGYVKGGEFFEIPIKPSLDRHFLH